VIAIATEHDFATRFGCNISKHRLAAFIPCAAIVIGASL
jgi:hypothetical protein